MQATQASPRAKACKRVCLSKRTDTAPHRTDKPRPKEGQLVTAVAVAQLLFLENSFEKYKILTSLEAILERFVF